MAKFQYRMQNILNIKNKIEDQEKSALAVANGRLHEEEEKLKNLMLRQAGYEKHARDLVMGEIDIKEIQSCKKAIDAMKSAVRTQMIAVHVEEKNVEVVRKRLTQVMLERKTHEKLKEKQFEVFKKELEAQESKSIDELVSFTHSIDNNYEG